MHAHLFPFSIVSVWKQILACIWTSVERYAQTVKDLEIYDTDLTLLWITENLPLYRYVNMQIYRYLCNDILRLHHKKEWMWNFVITYICTYWNYNVKKLNFMWSKIFKNVHWPCIKINSRTYLSQWYLSFSAAIGYPVLAMQRNSDDSELLPDVRAPHPVSRAEAQTPTGGNSFRPLASMISVFWALSRTHHDMWNVDQLKNWECSLLAQLPLITLIWCYVLITTDAALNHLSIAWTQNPRILELSCLGKPLTFNPRGTSLWLPLVSDPVCDIHKEDIKPQLGWGRWLVWKPQTQPFSVTRSAGWCLFCLLDYPTYGYNFLVVAGNKIFIRLPNATAQKIKGKLSNHIKSNQSVSNWLDCRVRAKLKRFRTEAVWVNTVDCSTDLTFYQCLCNSWINIYMLYIEIT